MTNIQLMEMFKHIEGKVNKIDDKLDSLHIFNKDLAVFKKDIEHLGEQILDIKTYISTLESDRKLTNRGILLVLVTGIINIVIFLLKGH